MVVAEDTRQQIHAGDKHANIHRHCKRNGIEVVRLTLPFGDYALMDSLEDRVITYKDANQEEHTVIRKVPIQGCGGVFVDTKKDFLEIASNLTKEHKRFKAECVKAQEAGCQLVILIEEIPPFGRVDMWESPVFTHSGRNYTAGQPMTRANPALLNKIMDTMHERYGVRFEFCDRSQTGRILLAILTGQYRYRQVG